MHQVRVLGLISPSPTQVSSSVLKYLKVELRSPRDGPTVEKQVSLATVPLWFGVRAQCLNVSI